MDLKNLEFRKNIKEARFYKEDYELKKDLIHSIEHMFNNALEEFLNNNPEIKNEWDSFMNKKSKQIEKLIKEKYSDISPEVKEDLMKEEIKKELTPKEIELKRIYREIVKISHPDKISNYADSDKEKRLKIYKECTQYYKNNDLSNLIYCADELNINYDTTLLDIDVIKKDIESYKLQSSMFENSVYWKWYRDGKDESLLNNFLSQQMLF